MSGIFRDVYLLKRPAKVIRDYRITTSVENTFARIDLDVSFTEGILTKVTLEDKNGAVAAFGILEKDGTLPLEVACPVLWNTENPYLYTLILETEYETIVDHVGFRTIEIVDKVLFFNGQKIKFRGVNRHDSYTQEELERAAHNYELEASDHTVLCLDYAQNGIGSNSCGSGGKQICVIPFIFKSLPQKFQPVPQRYQDQLCRLLSGIHK